MKFGLRKKVIQNNYYNGVNLQKTLKRYENRLSVFLNFKGCTID